MGMVILDPRSRSRSRHSVLSVVCEPRKQILEMSNKMSDISGEPTFFFVGDGRSPIATREIYTTPKNQIKMQNRIPSRVDAFVYKTRVTTNVWRSGARIQLRALSHANTWACGPRTGEASNLEHQRGHETRRSRRPKRGVAR